MTYLFIFRIIVFIILYFIFYIGYIYCGLGNWWITYINKYALKVANIHNIKINGEDKIQKLYESDKKFIVVLNHKTIF